MEANKKDVKDVVVKEHVRVAASDVLVKKRVRVAIIGTAGRGEDVKRMLDKSMYNRMVQKCAQIILDEWKLDPSNLTFVSGGSAWSDHCAVDLFLYDERFKASQLILYLPCQFKIDKFQDEKSWHTCGQTLNALHATFSTAIKRSTLDDIGQIEKRGGVLDCKNRGFFARNVKVGQVSDYMIALSSSKGVSPNDGGTAHTWKNSKTVNTQRKHVSLSIFLPSLPKQTMLNKTL